MINVLENVEDKKKVLHSNVSHKFTIKSAKVLQLKMAGKKNKITNTRKNIERKKDNMKFIT